MTNTINKAEIKKVAQKEFNHTFKVGDLFYTSWGYEQSNISFYQIIGFAGKSAILCKIDKISVEDTSWASRLVKPAKNSFIGEPFKKRIMAAVEYTGKIHFRIKMDETKGTLFQTNESETQYESWYA